MSVRTLILVLLCLLWASSAHAAASFVNAWSGSNSGGGTANFTIDTSTGTQMQANDLLVCFVVDFNAVTLNAPTGGSASAWTATVPVWQSTANTKSIVHTRLAAAGDIGATLTMGNASGNAFLSGGCAAIRGANQSTPIDVAGAGSAVGGDTTGNIVAASVSPAVANDLVLWFGTMDKSANAPVVIPSGYTSAWNINTTASIEGSTAAYKVPISSGATGTVTGTSGVASQDWQAVLVTVRPSVTALIGAQLQGNASLAGSAQIQ
jgi:hypothetical protein